MKLVLVGYMTSGKSTIGKILANLLEIDFIDLDNAISKQEDMSIPQIFNNKGELYFRKMEAQVLNNLLNSDKKFVLATGGGTPCYGDNNKLILEKATNSFYLKLPIPVLVNRITEEKNERPLVANILDAELPDFVGKHLFERSIYYSAAKNIIDCDNKSEEEIVNNIKSLLV